MAIRNVVIRGDALLTKKSRIVERFDERLHTLIDDMIETMHKKEGVGIAAPQVGVLRRVVIVEPNPETTMTLVNPEILERNFEMECEMVMSIRKNNFLSLKTRLKQIESLSITEEKDL